jgi:hypothetical protein
MLRFVFLSKSSFVFIIDNQVIDQTVRLTPPMFFAYNVVLLLSPCDGRMPYDDFIIEYQRRTASTHLLYPTDYGFPTMPRLFDAIQLVAQVRGRRSFKVIILNPEFRRMKFFFNFH